jgi:hypothetical protein
VAIAGGHVGVLLNRLRLFGIDELLGERALFAWSAGAMAVAERIVLFHDYPPQGGALPRCSKRGSDCARGLLPLPHARRRLRLDDPLRVALHRPPLRARPALAFDDGARLVLREGEIVDAVGVSRLEVSGGSIAAAVAA